MQKYNFEFMIGFLFFFFGFIHICVHFGWVIVGWFKIRSHEIKIKEKRVG